MSQPILARVLTFAGAIPFVVFSLCIAFSYYPLASKAAYIYLYLTYSVVILSFLAGIHWGLAISREGEIKLLLSSNLVALSAWVVLLLHHFIFAISLVILGYILQLGIDYGLSKQKIIPSWFFQLRTVVSSIVIISALLVLISLL